MCCHCECIAVPLSGVLMDGDESRLHVVDVVAEMLVQSQGNGSIDFVCFHKL